MNQTVHESLDDADLFDLLLTLDPSWEGGQTNRTENITKIDYFYFYEKEQLTMLWILFVSIVFGNCSVLITLIFSKGRGSRFRYFIKHLAIADLSVGLVSVLTDIIWRFTVEWKAGNIVCKIVKYSQVVVTYSSTYVLVALTIDRYDAIRHPMNFTKSWKRAKILVASAWLLSFFFSTPIIVLYEEKYIEGNLQCWIDLLEMWHWQIYMSLISLTVFFIPACIIATCYAIIIYTIWSKTNILSQNKMNRHPVCEVSDSQTEDTDCRRVSSRGLIPKAKIKTIKMTLIIVFVFIFCWSPYMIFDLLQVFGYIERTQSNIALATFIQSLAPLNSAANPIIYCVFSTFVCRVQRKSVPLRWLTKWCFQSTHLGTGRKVSDTVTISNVTRASSNKYANLPKFEKKLTRLNRKMMCSSDVCSQH
ncbi:UNVERIFIED_CONTAM: hypothetical protein PYX00_009010 [Menopon gallinae]|uniref:G-protein coupled receptors family 1 profile domain-containing protein n=1 Tax=Menopon gallinae TaxID=328185 RepID=A0AAW2H9M7_9NEOP